MVHKGPVGTHVTVAGSGFARSLASAPVVIVTLNREFPNGCGLVGGLRVLHMHIAEEGKLTGQFVITPQGSCFKNLAGAIR
jgi:hypothetical protein